MLKTLIEFVLTNIVDILLILVGASAAFTYVVQERSKLSEAASLIVLQVDELRTRLSKISSYIVDRKLNENAFYESQILLKTDYWEKYKHYFVNKMDPQSYRTFDNFYDCVSEILEQQQLLKNLQKNTFFLTQQVLMQSETSQVSQSMELSREYAAREQKILKTVEALKGTDAQKELVQDVLWLAKASNQRINQNAFWGTYNQKKEDFLLVLNNNAFTHYTPTQIQITLEKALKEYSMIQIIGCEGYRKLRKIASRKI